MTKDIDYISRLIWIRKPNRTKFHVIKADLNVLPLKPGIYFIEQVVYIEQR